jgi:hypothetical protein
MINMDRKSAQLKGDRFENHITQILRKEVDKNTHRVQGSGSGLDQNDVRIPKLNIEIECKNASQFNLKGDWEQLEAQLTTGMTGVLAIRHPSYPEFRKTLIVLELNDWLELLKGNSGGEVEVVNSFAPEDKWKVIKAINALKELKKLFEKLGIYEQ